MLDALEDVVEYGRTRIVIAGQRQPWAVESLEEVTQCHQQSRRVGSVRVIYQIAQNDGDIWLDITVQPLDRAAQQQRTPLALSSRDDRRRDAVVDVRDDGNSAIHTPPIVKPPSWRLRR